MMGSELRHEKAHCRRKFQPPGDEMTKEDLKSIRTYTQQHYQKRTIATHIDIPYGSHSGTGKCFDIQAILLPEFERIFIISSCLTRHCCHCHSFQTEFVSFSPMPPHEKFHLHPTRENPTKMLTRRLNTFGTIESCGGCRGDREFYNFYMKHSSGFPIFCNICINWLETNSEMWSARKHLWVF